MNQASRLHTLADLSSSAAAKPARPRRLARLLLPLLVLGAAGLLLAYAARAGFEKGREVEVAPVIPVADNTVARPGPDAPSDQARRAGAIVQAPGWLEPDPYAIVVPALAEGVVATVHALEGERVEAGQVLARLVDDDAKLLAAAAEASLAGALAEVERAAAAIGAAQAQARLEHAAVEELADEVDRKRDLIEVGGVAAGEFRRLEIRLGGFQARAEAAERSADEARAVLVQAEAAVAAARVARDEANLRLARMAILAPADGVVLARYVEPGMRISMNAREADAGPMSGAVMRLYDPSRLQARVDVPLADAARVALGWRAVVTTEAAPDAAFAGVVKRIVHEANIQRNTVQFKVPILDPAPVLKPGMLVRVRLSPPASSEEASGAPGPGSSGNVRLLVPARAAALLEGDRRAVWTVESRAGALRASRREVTVAASERGDYLAVVSGLVLTDRVVIDPPPTLREGERLVIRALGRRTEAP